MSISLHYCQPLKWSSIRSKQQQQQQQQQQQLKCALTKQGQRFLTTLTTSTTTAADQCAKTRLIRKFIASSPKSVCLNVLTHLLSPNTTHPHLSSLALPLYLQISEASWFQWNSKLVAEVVGLMGKVGLYGESEALIADTIVRLRSKERDTAQFYFSLIECYSKHNCLQGFDECFSSLYRIVKDSKSVYVKQRGYESMICGLCTINKPSDAESLIEEMKAKGLKQSGFHFKSAICSYGKLGMFDDMKRCVEKMESAGFEMDTICANMVLSSYGMHSMLSDLVLWLQKMKDLRIPFSIRTYNSVLNSCPAMMSMLEDMKSFPLSIQELMENLNGDESLIVQELVGSSILNEILRWDPLEVKLDLHGMHLASAYLIVLEWMGEMQRMFNNMECEIPEEVTVICGAGKHSNIRGQSPVKNMVKEIMIRKGSPMRIDRKNIGCFIAKGKAVKAWLC